MIDLANILFLDIETARITKDYQTIPERLKEAWSKKSLYINEENTPEENYYERAGIYAEFGKVVCISVGYFNIQDSVSEFRMKSFYGENEAQLLQGFSALINKMNRKRTLMFCAHNGREFDFPYLSRRLLINNLPIPKALNLQDKKPWEVQHFDTLQLWKFGDYKHYTSLDLLAAVFNIPSSKDKMDGSMVSHYFYDGKIEEIKTYCEKDVWVTAQVFCKLKSIPIAATSIQKIE